MKTSFRFVPPTVLHLLPLCLFAFAVPFASAQSVRFAPVEKPLPIPATAFAVDSSGNVFYLNVNADVDLRKVTPAGVTTVLTTDFRGPNDIKVDPVGDVYVADNNVDNEVPDFLFKITPDGQETLFAEGLFLGVDVFGERQAFFAVDSAGNIYAARPGAQAITKIAPNGSTTTLASGFRPGSITVDANANVFVEDGTNARVMKITPSGAQTDLLTGLSLNESPKDLEVDSSGNLYVSSGQQIIKLSPAGAQTLLFSGDSFDGSGFNGIGVDVSGNLYTGIARTPSSAILELTTATAVFGDLDFGGVPKSFKLVQPVTFTFESTVSVGSIKVLTNGAPNQDFQAAAGGTCTTQTYNAGQTCTVNVQLTPTQAGLRVGSLVLNDSQGNVLINVNLRANGLVNAQALNPGVQTNILSGLKDPSAVAVDGLGDTFIVDKGNSRVVKLSSSGVQSTVGSGLLSPTGVAEDGMGNVYISDTANDRVVKVTPAGNQTVVLSGLNTPDGVAVDGAGNLYVADAGNNRVVKLAVDGVTQSTVGSGYARPTGVTVDGLGNVFVADLGNNQIVKVNADRVQSTVIGNLSSPSGVAADAAGNLYVSEVGANQVVEIPTTATSVTPTTIVGGLNFPFDAVLVAVNSTGNLFVADTFNNRVLQIDRSRSSLSFGTVKSGQSSAAQTVTVQFVGNDFFDTNFTESFPSVTAVNNSNFHVTNNFSNCAVDLNSNNFLTACVLTVTFTPKQTGLQTASVTISSAGGTQVVTMTGTGQ
jgi:sugar lactone lactonase YvrE